MNKIDMANGGTQKNILHKLLNLRDDRTEIQRLLETYDILG